MRKQPAGQRLHAEKLKRFQRWEWRVRAASRVFFLLFLGAATLGLFGHGPFARASLSRDNILLEYDRFARSEASFQVRLNTANDTTRVVIERLFLPEDEVRADPGSLTETHAESSRSWTFLAVPDADTTLRLTWKPSEPGLHRGRLIVDDVPFEVRTLVYP